MEVKTELEKGLGIYLTHNPVMDMTITGISKEPITFNTVDECMFTMENLEEKHEVISGKIAFVNGLLEKFRNLHLEKKSEFKSDESRIWAETKNTKTDKNEKVLSDKRVDMEVQYSTELVDANKKVLNIATQVRRLEGFVTDLRGAKVAMETILKTRIV